jgi:hypothetical protein
MTSAAGCYNYIWLSGEHFVNMLADVGGLRICAVNIRS